MNTPLAPTRRAACRAPLVGRAAGLTLIELMIVLAITGTLVSVTAPSFVRVLDAASMTTASNTFLSSLRLARSESRKRGGRVALCASADGVRCAGSGGWEQGWILFQDRNGNGQFDSGEPLIQVQQAMGRQLVMTGNRPVAKYIAYTSGGVSRAAAGGLLAGTVTVCKRSADPGPARQIVLSSGGRPRVQPAEVDQCG